MAPYPGDILVPRSVTAKGGDPEQGHSLVEGTQMGQTPGMGPKGGTGPPGSAAPRMSRCPGWDSARPTPVTSPGCPIVPGV